MIKDMVKCCNCGWKGLANCGEVECPQCNFEGGLTWQNPNKPEIEEDEYLENN